MRNQSDESWRDWIGISATILLAIWYPLSTLAEPSISVASSLRWLTAAVFFLACLILSRRIQRVDRASEPTASASFAVFDQIFSALSLHTILPWLGMGAIVGVSVMTQSTGVPGLGGSISWAVWLVAGLMALAAMFLIIARRFFESEDRSQIGTAWTIAASVLLLSPILAWVLLQIVVNLIADPIHAWLSRLQYS
jgi:phosphoglycerol transferase MdoB-like AlkP superfamily enzyme